MTPVRRFPFGHDPAPLPEQEQEQEPAPMPTASLPAPGPLETALLESFVPPPRVLPFRVATILPPKRAPEAPPRPEEAPTPSRSRRWLRIAFVVVSLLLYVAAILIIVAPISWGP